MSCFVVRAQQMATIPSLTRLSTAAFGSRFYSNAVAAAAIKSGRAVKTAPWVASTKRNALQALPGGVLLRSLAILSMASLPQPALSALIRAVKRHSAWVDSNPILRTVSRRTFYRTFCMGETKTEIVQNVDELRQMGIRGIILAFAREAEGSNKSTAHTPLTTEEPELRSWVEFNLKTIEKLHAGDYLAVRCTGAGKSTLRCMDDVFELSQTLGREIALRRACADIEAFKAGLYEICAAAQSRGIRVLIDAEDTRRQITIDHVALGLMSTFNRGEHAVVLNTYQMYLKSGIDKLQEHLQHSIENGYALGVKMVRGAYIHTEPDRNLIHGTKEKTDRAFDEAVRLLITADQTRRAGETAETPKIADKRWEADVMLATHNTYSATEALRLYRKLIHSEWSKDSPRTGLRSLTFAQLKGMADELSLELTAEIKQLSTEASRAATEAPLNGERRFPSIGVYKYSVWGTFQECLLYMLRRAEENKDAVARSRTTALAMAKELGIRLLPLKRR